MTRIEERTAADLMSRPILAVERGLSLREAGRRMVEAGVHCLMVEPASPRRAAGILTGKDVVQVLGDADPTVLDELTVGDAMTTPAISVPAGYSIPDCVNLMRMAGVRRVFVVEDGEAVGLLSFTDVLREVCGSE